MIDPYSIVFISERIFSIFSALAAAISVMFGVYSTIRTARKIRIGEENANVGITPEEVSNFERHPEKGAKPFEITALANYYNQALSRANISFWFSIVFASIGFGVIIFAFLSHSKDDLSGTIIKVASGAVIDTVSGLFFIQSTNAQKSMSEFFEKLRLDRLNVEARE